MRNKNNLTSYITFFVNDNLNNNNMVLILFTIFLITLTFAFLRIISSRDSSTTIYKETLLRVYANAVNSLANDTYFPWSISRSNGARNRFFTYLKPTKDSIFEKALIGANNDAEAKTIVIKYIIGSPNLFKKRSEADHFANHFLCRLSEFNIKLFWGLLEKSLGIKFVKSGITLYRRDSRNSKIIFKEGFRLQDIVNNAEQSKYQSTESVTYDYGVSTSDVIPPAHYGRYCYKIVIPDDHSFVIVDIAHSPKNKVKLTPYEKKLREFNVLNDIQPQYIQKCTDGKKTVWCGLFNKKINNSSFNPKLQRIRKLQGCYT